MSAQSPQLKYLNNFQEALSNYQPSSNLIGSLRKVKFVLLSAPTAAGRNTLIRSLCLTGKYHYVVSDTTRQPRVNNGIAETSGIEYWFKPEQEFLEGLEKGNYLEAAIIHNQQVSGINGSEFRAASSASKVAITDIDVHGCDTVVRYSENALPIFILPPTYQVWMQRLDKRGVMPADEKRRRLVSAVEEISIALKKPYFKLITNNEVAETNKFLDKYIFGDATSMPNQTAQRAHAKALLKELAQNIGLG
jgi:guanylate kinase